MSEVDVFARPRVAILSTGNEIVEPGQPLAARPDLRHQPVHAVIDHSMRTAACQSRGRTAPDDLDRAVGGGRRARGGRHRRFFRRQLGRRTRSDPRRAAGSAARSSFTGSRSSPESRRCSAGSDERRCSACRATRRRASRTPTSCSCRCSGAMARLPSIARTSVRMPLARRIVSTTGRHQFYTVRIADGAAGARIQGVGRHHQHGACGRIHRDPGRRPTSSKPARSWK